MNTNTNTNTHIKFVDYLIKKHKISYINNDIIIEMLDLIIKYVNDNICQIIYTDLNNIIYHEIYNILFIQYIETGAMSNILNVDKNVSISIFKKYIKISFSIIFKYFIPKRSYQKTYIRHKTLSILYKNIIQNKINYLKNIIQPEQRTDEWYIFRNSTLTASNIWKIFFSESSQSQLILEKCEPLQINKFKVTNYNSPLHWGQKYEPVSILYYEYLNKTKVSEFGCIPHAEHKYIAASPDGIVCDENSLLFGRMLEIKNVVSREITGIPKMEYWIQMQIQMEVCDLNECDFLETKFVEYELEEDYISDKTTEYKGIIMQFYKDNVPHYEYAPIMLNDLESDDYKEWYNEQINKNKDIEYIRNIYWKLETISCVLVLRNKFWFKNIQPSIKAFWENLLYERTTEKYKDRIKKKRKYENDEFKQINHIPSGCLIDTNMFKNV